MIIFSRFSFLTVAVTLLVGGGLFGTGCTGKKTDADNHTIRVVRNIGGREGFRKHWDAWKADFASKNPGWTMELIDTGDSDLDAYYKQRISTDDLPDMIMGGEFQRMADEGYLQPIPGEFYDKFGIPRPLPYKGKYYSSQTGIQCQGMVVNKTMWQSIGVTAPPASWPEFIADLRKLKAKGYQPLAYGGSDWSAGQPLAMAFATNMYPYTIDVTKPSWTKLVDTGKSSFVTDPTAQLIMKNMIALLDEFTEKGAASDGYAEEQKYFYTGKAATWFMGCWVGGDIEPQKVTFDAEYWPFPSMTGRKPIFYRTAYPNAGWFITTSAKGERYQKCLAAFEALYDPEVYQLYLNGESMLANAAKVPVKGPTSDWAPAQRLYDSMNANLKQFGFTVASNQSYEDQEPVPFQDAEKRVMQEILTGDTDTPVLLKMLDDAWINARKGR
jgi:ABC-type glycerol-3-phosphate transport system substrate-binding protein